MNIQSYLVYVWISGQDLHGQIAVLKSAPKDTPPNVAFALRDLLKHALTVLNHNIVQPADHHTTARIIEEMYETIYAVRRDVLKAPKWASATTVNTWCKIREIVSWEEQYNPNSKAELVTMVMPAQTIQDYRRHMQAMVAYYQNLFRLADIDEKFSTLTYDCLKSQYIVGHVTEGKIFGNFYQVQDHWKKILKKEEDYKNKHAITEVEKWRLNKAYNDMVGRKEQGEQSNQHVIFDNHTFGPLPPVEMLENYLDVIKYYYVAREVTYEINGKPVLYVGDPHMSVILRIPDKTDRLFHFSDKPWEECLPALMEFIQGSTHAKTTTNVE